MAEPPWPSVRMREAQSLVRVIRGPQLFLPFSHPKTQVRVVRGYIRSTQTFGYFAVGFFPRMSATVGAADIPPFPTVNTFDF